MLDGEVVLQTLDPDPGVLEVEVRGLEGDRLRDAQPVAVHEEDEEVVAGAVPAADPVTTQTFNPGTADERVIGYEYYENGTLKSITPPGRPLHLFDYTPVNLEKKYDPPSVGAFPPDTTYLYTDDRQLTDILRPDGQNVSFGYEPVGGRLASVTIASVTGPGSEVRTYSYAGTGNLQTLTGLDADLTFGHDGSLLTSEQWSAGSLTSTVFHTYDNNFRLKTLKVDPQTAIIFDYDNDGLLTQAGDLDPITREREPEARGTSSVI